METEPRRVSDAHQGDAQAEIASLEDALAQLTAVATRLVLGHRELEEEAVAIQTEMDSIHNAQDARARQIAGRLQSAGASILAFGEPNAADQVETIDDDDAVYAQQ